MRRDSRVIHIGGRTVGAGAPGFVMAEIGLNHGGSLDRALALDESFGDGAVHQLLIRYELVRQGAPGDPVERARKHYQRSLELARGSLAGPFVTWAENVSVQKQDAAEFKKLLAQALAVNVDAKPEARLENLIMQRRAKWLLSRADDLILPAAPPPEKPATTAPEK